MRPPRPLLGPLIAVHPFQSDGHALILGDQKPGADTIPRNPSVHNLSPSFSAALRHARQSEARWPVCASRPSRYVSVINDNHLVSLMNFNAAKVN
jgi:hypothetical protein